MGNVSDLLLLAPSAPPRAREEAALDPLCLQPHGAPGRAGAMEAPSTCCYLGCRAVRGERSAPWCVLNHTHQTAAKALIWRVQGAPRGSPGAAGKATHLRGKLPKARRDSSAVSVGLPTRERRAGSDGAQTALKLPQVTQLFHPSPSPTRPWLPASPPGLLSGFPVSIPHTNKEVSAMAAL